MQPLLLGNTFFQLFIPIIFLLIPLLLFPFTKPTNYGRKQENNKKKHLEIQLTFFYFQQKNYKTEHTTTGCGGNDGDGIKLITTTKKRQQKNNRIAKKDRCEVNQENKYKLPRTKWVPFYSIFPSYFFQTNKAKQKSVKTEL